jgi:hypothetical protein
VQAVELWGTDNQAKEYSNINVETGAEVDTKCNKCRGQAQIQAASAVAGRTFYSIRLNEGLDEGLVTGGPIFLHGFDLDTKSADKIDLPGLSKFSGSFATGAWGLAAEPVDSAFFGTVYVFGPTGNEKDITAHGLFSVDTKTKNVTLISKEIAFAPTAQSSTFDSKNRVLYVMYQNDIANAIKGFSVANGSVVCDYPTRMYTIDFNPKDGLLYGVSLAFGADEEQFRQLQTVDPVTGKSETLLNMTDYQQNVPSTAFDPVTEQLVTLLIPKRSTSGSMVVIDVNTRKILSSPTLCSDEYHCPWNLEWVASN